VETRGKFKNFRDESATLAVFLPAPLWEEISGGPARAEIVQKAAGGGATQNVERSDSSFTNLRGPGATRRVVHASRAKQAGDPGGRGGQTQPLWSAPPVCFNDEPGAARQLWKPKHSRIPGRYGVLITYYLSKAKDARQQGTNRGPKPFAEGAEM